jgi:1-deoxy-D-xylulose-5-phosphate synthase
MRPFCAIYSTFLQRAYDQVVTTSRSRIAGALRDRSARAGGADGATHAGSFDVTYLATLPNFVVMAAADEAELVHMTYTAASMTAARSPLRYPRGNGVGIRCRRCRAAGDRQGPGRARGQDRRDPLARHAACRGAEGGGHARRADSPPRRGLRFAKPLDEALIRRLLATHEVAVTIEEGAIGGSARMC